jgi:hypothetical protein
VKGRERKQREKRERKEAEKRANAGGDAEMLKSQSGADDDSGGGGGVKLSVKTDGDEEASEEAPFSAPTQPEQMNSTASQNQPRTASFSDQNDRPAPPPAAPPAAEDDSILARYLRAAPVLSEEQIIQKARLRRREEKKQGIQGSNESRKMKLRGREVCRAG